MKYVNKNDRYGNFLISPCQRANPKVSVIMSVYNAQNTVHSSVKSITNTSCDYEFLISDDGSNDNTLSILEGIARDNDRIIIIKQKNMGLTKTLNRLIECARGEYIARQDADDISYPGRLDFQLRALKSGEYNFSVSRYNLNGSPQPKKIFLKNFEFQDIRFGNIFCHGTFFGSREIFENYYNDNFYYAQDVEFLLRLRDQIRLYIFSETLYEYGVSSNQISNVKKKEQDKFFFEAVRVHLNKNVIKSRTTRKILKNLRAYLKYGYCIFNKSQC